MSVTISKKASVPITPHNPDLVFITTVYNPIEKRISVNICNTSMDDALTVLMHSQLVISGYSGDVSIVSNEIPKTDLVEVVDG